MKTDLTDPDIRAITPPTTGRLELHDSKVPGLVLRVTAAGLLTWCCRTRTRDGKQTRPKLGTYPGMSLAEARKAARGTLSQVQSGSDPIAEKQAARAARKAREAEATVADRLAEWQAARTNDPVNPWSERHAAEIERLIKHDVPAKLTAKPLVSTSRADWTSLVSAKRKATPAAASNLYRALSAFLNYAEASGWIPAPLLPRKGAAMLAPAVAARERILSDDELRRVWLAANREAARARAFVRLLFLTAARESEVAGITTGEIDFSAGRWTIPADRSKNGVPLTVPLCGLALTELRAVWPAEPRGPGWRLLGRSGTAPFSGFSNLKDRLDLASGVDAWRWHDIRRTARTGMTRLGVPRDHAEAAINHVSGRSALERTYDRHTYADEVIAALGTWQRHVAGLLASGDE
jgi:integrase